MAKQYLYRISLLKKSEAHPLEKLAYFTGNDQFDSIDGKVYTSSTADKVLWSDLIIPDRMNDFEAYCNLPEYLKIRNRKPDMIRNLKNILWRDVAVMEKKVENQCARVFELKLPAFLEKEAAIETVESFGKHLMKQGMLVDASIHDFNMVQAPVSLFDKVVGLNSGLNGLAGMAELFGFDDEPEKPEETAPAVNTQDYKAYLMCTLRSYKDGYFTTKNREWNTYDSLMQNRKAWFNILEQQIDFCDVEPSVKTKWLGKLNNFKEIEKKEHDNPMNNFRGFKP